MKKIISRLNNSIASELLRVVFGLYLVVAIVVTLAQMVFEYRHVEHQLTQKIQGIKDSYGPSLATSLWTFNKEQIHSIMTGVSGISVVTGMSIDDGVDQYNSGVADEQKAQLPDEKNSNNVSLFNRVLKFEFPIIYDDEGKKHHLGTGIIFSNTRIILDQVKYGFILIIVNSVIKTFLLWLILVYFLRKIISKPLTHFATVARDINFNNIDNAKIDIESRNDNELKTLVQAFNIMLKNLSHAKHELKEVNAALEEKVAERTEELEQEVDVRERAQKQAEAANEMKTKFLANMSHEIRTPMTCILGMAQILDATETDADKKEKFNLIVRNGDRLMGVINSILDYSKLESDGLDLEISEYNLRDCVSSNVELFAGQAKQKDIELNYHVEDDVPVMCHGDTARLGQIITNLLSNAIKFSDDGEIVANVCVHDNKRQILFSIKDNGIGIAKDKQDEVFEEFIQADASTTRKYGGTGLGLAICKRFVEMMGGSIWIDSKLGHGSTIYFSIDMNLSPANVNEASIEEKR